jgi:four helix bundle protein
MYRVCENFPRHELFGLAGQMRRAAVSVPSNIAEGRGRRTTGEYRHFLYQARGSSYELETQIEIAKQLGYISREQAGCLTDDVNEVQRLIHGVIRSVSSRPS